MVYRMANKNKAVRKLAIIVCPGGGYGIKKIKEARCYASKNF